MTASKSIHSTLFVCLTGGIATGKSRVADWLKTQDWSVVCSDEIVHDLYQPGQSLVEEISKAFGPDVLTPSKSVDRKKLGALVFQDSSARQRLNDLVHPHVRTEWRTRSSQLLQNGQKTIVVIPLAFETGVHREFHQTWVIACDDAEQRRRLKTRGLNDLQIQQRLSSQWPLQKKIDLADRVIWNNSAWSLTEEQLKLMLNA